MHTIPHLFSPLAIAPMIDWTYTHFRVLMRILAPKALLYTDMQTPGAIQHNPSRSLYFHPMESPLALQLGGADPKALVMAAQLAEQQGYQEINLNLGCPSDRVQAGQFGACLMAEPEKVADCIHALKQAVQISVTAKTRIGIDHQDSFDFFATFAKRLIDAGCDKLIIHARKAWLNGLSPKQNRTIPPLHYDYVYKIKEVFPKTPIIINGNVLTIDDISTHLKTVDGVMLGRLAYQNPYAIAEIHHALYPEIVKPSREMVIKTYFSYLSSLQNKSISASLLIKPLFNLYHGLPGSTRFKKTLMLLQQSKTIDELTKELEVDSFSFVN